MPPDKLIMKFYNALHNEWRLVGLVFGAFLLMTLSSYLYVSTVMKSQIDLHSRNELMTYQASLRALLQANENALLYSLSVITMNLDRNASPDEQLETLRALTNNYRQQKDIKDVFQSVYAFIDGNFIDSSGLISGTFFNPKTASWLRGAILTKGVYHTEPSIDPKTGQAIVSLSIVAFDKKGESRGVIGYDYLLAPIIEQVNSFKVADAGFGFLADKSKTVLNFRDVTYVGKKLTEIPGFEDFDSKFPSTDDDILIERLKINKVKHISFFSKIENGWYLGILAPEGFYYKDVKLMLPAIFIISLALAMFLSVILVRLSEDKKRSQEENRLKSSFLARMSHEIRTPMNAIIGLSELAHRDYGIPQGVDYIIEIKKAGSNLLGIINDILDFSKIESGKYNIIIDKYHTNRLLSDVLSMMAVRFKETSLLFMTDIDENLPSGLLGDERSIRQVLLNLLSNAIKYTNVGHVKLTATFQLIDEAQLYLIFSIEDTGIGIKEEDIKSLFGDFVRIENSHINRYVEGTGLGLSIAKNICNLMGGDITVKSEYGLGSTFTATFLQGLFDPNPIEGLPNYSSKPHSTQTLTTFEAPNFPVLIVDDVATNLMVATGLMAPYKFPVTTCLSGLEAVRLAEKNDFKLFLIDQMMPVTDGCETLKLIRNISEQYRHVPAIVFTANAVTGAKEMLLSFGFNDFISKPIDSAELAEILNKWVPNEFRITKEIEKIDAPYNSTKIDLADSLKLIPGLDYRFGLKNCEYNEQKYSQILNVFTIDANNYLSNIVKIEKLTDNDEIENFVIRVHGMKSASANIGAMKLSQQAAFLEQSGLDRSFGKVFSDVYDSFILELKYMVERIKSVLNQSQTTGSAKHSDDNDNLISQDIFSKLREALTAMNVREADQILDEITSKTTGETKLQLEAISDLLLYSDFTEALQLLDKLSHNKVKA